jgi:ABC-type molybdate transport system permease subunit
MEELLTMQKLKTSGLTKELFKLGVFFIGFCIFVAVVVVVFPTAIKIVNDCLSGIDRLIRSF